MATDIIKELVTDEGATGYCHNKKCEVYNGIQGAAQLLGLRFRCCVCDSPMHKSKEDSE